VAAACLRRQVQALPRRFMQHRYPRDADGDRELYLFGGLDQMRKLSVAQLVATAHRKIGLGIFAEYAPNLTPSGSHHSHLQRHQAPADQTKLPSDERPSRTNAKDDQGFSCETVPLRQTRPAASKPRRLHSKHTTSPQVSRRLTGSCVTKYLKNLGSRASSIHPEPDATDAETEHRGCNRFDFHCFYFGNCFLGLFRRLLYFDPTNTSLVHA